MTSRFDLFRCSLQLDHEPIFLLAKNLLGGQSDTVRPRHPDRRRASNAHIFYRGYDLTVVVELQPHLFHGKAGLVDEAHDPFDPMNWSEAT